MPSVSAISISAVCQLPKEKGINQSYNCSKNGHNVLRGGCYQRHFWGNTEELGLLGKKTKTYGFLRGIWGNIENFSEFSLIVLYHSYSWSFKLIFIYLYKSPSFLILGKYEERGTLSSFFLLHLSNSVSMFILSHASVAISLCGRATFLVLEICLLIEEN